MREQQASENTHLASQRMSMLLHWARLSSIWRDNFNQHATPSVSGSNSEPPLAASWESLFSSWPPECVTTLSHDISLPFMTHWTRQCIHFMCSVSNEAILFAKAIAVTMETEEAATVAKKTVYGTKTSRIRKVDSWKQISFTCIWRTSYALGSGQRKRFPYRNLSTMWKDRP